VLIENGQLEKVPVTKDVNRNQAYEIACKMFQLEDERWAKNALGLLGALVAIFAGFAALKTYGLQLGLGWPFLLAAVVSAAAVLVALSIRGTTDAWRKTVEEIENSPDGSDFKVYHLFTKNLDRDRPWKDFKKTFFLQPWNKKWRRDVLLSVTRLYALLFGLAFVVATCAFVWFFFGGAIRWIWWRTVEGTVWKNMNIAGLGAKAMALVLTIVGVVVSLAAAWFVLWQGLLTRRSIGAETLLHLDDQWDGDGWLRIRAAAAATLRELRAKQTTVQHLYDSEESDIDEVLDFFETVVFFYQRKVLDGELVWNMFYWPMENYCIACADYVKFVRTKEGDSTWANLCSELRRLRKFSRGEPIPDDTKVDLFLRTEVRKKALLLATQPYNS
jgi:hypothetical protein